MSRWASAQREPQRTSPDPLEHFHRDPLAAPLPAAAVPAPSANRMMLRPVANGRTESTAGRAAHSRQDRLPDPLRRPDRMPEPGYRGGHRAVHQPAGGRHRVLRSVEGAGDWPTALG
ncbi:hypothetical protein [Pseudonocardia spinosispora]|uniref:hypothetical protein n=1 Tax=Pseudonocardia spinosispora TaxID=103441 RepID=UPI00040EAEE3|nr:hypothetical protein [Pseudonocardia spinosispora]